MDAPSLIEEIRFGYGPRAGRAPSPGGLEPDRLLAQLGATDPEAAALDRPPLAARWAQIGIFTEDRKAGLVKMGAQKAQAETRALIAMEEADFESFVLRPAVAQLTFVERLVNVWANRITVAANGFTVRHYIQDFRDGAIRPHVGGRLADMLKATLWHPAMQVYLTQSQSTGPNSRLGKRRAKGLNENLAREFLELHTMGTGYSQADVTEIARLLAGMKNDADGPRTEDARTEPGKKTILGVTYGEGMAEIDRLVEDIAHRPETAQATALYIARHFIADSPPEDMVSAMARALTENDTELPALYRAMLTHPAAADPQRQKLRSPQELVVAGLRLTGLTGTEKGLRGFRKDGMKLADRLRDMGQPVYQPARPDGWPEVAAGWLTPPMMAARVDWSIDLARGVGTGREASALDPVGLARFALGDLAGPQVIRATGGAEQRWEGLAVLLASPDFSRR